MSHPDGRCIVGQITGTFPRIPARQEGRFAIVTNVGPGMRWTRRGAAGEGPRTNGMARTAKACGPGLPTPRPSGR
ncbi:hypothetical protein BRADO5922 [Bradyrhizobium sp. ORS 278]|nr:hypothetical protein BRADO5922 [Bradyrhizobium sp. ORS 278]